MVYHTGSSKLKSLKKPSDIQKKTDDVKYEVRPMRKIDVPQALDVWRETGMQEGTHSIYSWLKFDPQGFYVAITNSGEVLGTCTAVINHDDLAFIGLYSVREKYRGLGIGSKIWNACMEHVGTRNVALNAAPGTLEMYRDKCAFPIVEDRWEILLNEINQSVSPANLSDQVPFGVRVQHCRESDLSLIYEFDFNLVGYKRDLVIKLTSQEQDTKTVVAIKDGECIGYGTIRKTCQGIGYVGPLYANDYSVAEVILRRLIVSAPEMKGLFIGTDSNNAAANDLVKRLGCHVIGQCQRLYRREKVNVDTNKVFAFFSLNFSPF
ncbi:uncharacterized protein LOC118180634 isoform X2 [Stegodyphus dumicola]|uniref:uncharacterized protein LOC118180634 isoform X2 n=1 Tax=Stegodyphus dumicola TaxID=202533 RepID=UPI0015B1E516|nr:uncharacterized protein LOC118180634 isoform X2 [Stegodyphus dumicola]